MDNELKPLSEIASYAGTTPDYLRYLIFKKKFKGQKIGKIWFSKMEWVDNYKSGLHKENNASVVAKKHESKNPDPAIVELLSRIEKLEKGVRSETDSVRPVLHSIIKSILPTTAAILTLFWFGFFVLENHSAIVDTIGTFKNHLVYFVEEAPLIAKLKLNNFYLTEIKQSLQKSFSQLAEEAAIIKKEFKNFPVGKAPNLSRIIY